MICLQEVSFCYAEDERRLTGLNLQVSKGECVVLCGRSGCGKTTALRIVNGLAPHFYEGTLEGTATAVGAEIKITPLYEMAQKVGSVFQNPKTQFFSADVASEIAFGLENLSRPSSKIRQQVQRTAELLGLEGLLARRLQELSGGEKQKVAIASAAALEPEILVLDEPSANLDAGGMRELQNVLRLLKSQGKTIVIAEHRLQYLSGVADRLVYIDKGQVRAEFTTAEFLQLPSPEREALGLRAMKFTALAGSDAVRPERRPPHDKALAVKKLQIGHRKQALLATVSFEAAYGDVVAVLGPNGAGKTTLVQTLCGLRREYGGEVCWDGAVLDLSRRRGLSYLVFQDVHHQLFAESVIEECALGAVQEPKEMAEAVLAQLGLEIDMDRHPQTLSGGQKQRLAVAVSRMYRKKLVVFDEPTSGLDYEGMIRVCQVMQDLAAQGCVLLVVSHDYELLSRVCNKAVFLNGKGDCEHFFMDVENKQFLREFLTVYN